MLDITRRKQFPEPESPSLRRSGSNDLVRARLCPLAAKCDHGGTAGRMTHRGRTQCRKAPVAAPRRRVLLEGISASESGSSTPGLAAVCCSDSGLVCSNRGAFIRSAKLQSGRDAPLFVLGSSRRTRLPPSRRTLPREPPSARSGLPSRASS